MFGTIFKYSAVAIGGMVLLAVGMHYGDEKVLEEVRQDLVSVREKAIKDGNDPKAAIEVHVATNYGLWRSRLTLALNVEELDVLVASAKK